MSDKIVAAIRTGAAALGVIVLGWLATKMGLDFSDEVDAQIILGLGVLAVGVWNWCANWLAEKWPILGYLLLIPRQPTYQAPDSQNLLNDDAGEIRVVELVLVVLATVLVVLIALRLL